MSVLKTVLENAGFRCEVMYWNIALEDIMTEYLLGIKPDSVDEISALGIFSAYLGVSNNDSVLLQQQEALLRTLKPQYVNSMDFNFQEHIHCCVKNLKDLIVRTLKDLCIDDCLFMGMHMNLFQWLPATILSEIIKELYPNTFIAVGGLGNPKEANAFLQSFNCFDLAMWGEGESAICSLAKDLYSSDSQIRRHDINPIPQSYLKNSKGVIDLTIIPNKFFYNLSELPFVDYSDFFTQYNGDKDILSIPIEGSRGCHWNRCKFCFLNQGYKYRRKSTSRIIEEIRHYIKIYNVLSISFLDNDLIGGNLEDFGNLLDGLSAIKTDFPDFKVEIAEIISKGISKEYIRKMHLAGFIHVQIGYESPSDSILKKINKKNTFASNLLFIKWASIYSIHIGGMNILRGLLDEKPEDILEGIHNIYFLRFYNYEHNISSLAINDASRYFNEIDTDILLSDSYSDSLKEIVPRLYLPRKYEVSIFQYVRRYQDKLWEFFRTSDNYYKSNMFSYDLYYLNEDTIIYTEYCNLYKIKSISFNTNELSWRILVACNDAVMSKADIYSLFSEESSKHIDESIDSLNEHGILFYSPINLECISIINTHNIL